jgi:holliday junction DNA helicase RuvA
VYDHLHGEILEAHPARVVIRAGGVGYELKVPMTTSAALSPGQEALLYTVLHVVDGQPTLLGFVSRAERDLARKMMSVSGVGPSTSLAILSMYSARMVVEALRDGNYPLLQKAKGIGAKTAERLCLELKDHAGKLDLGAGTPTEPTVSVLPQASEDAVAALMTLGYPEKEARKKVLKRCEQDPTASTEELVKRVLQS